MDVVSIPRTARFGSATDGLLLRGRQESQRILVHAGLLSTPCNTVLTITEPSGLIFLNAVNVLFNSSIS